MHVSALEALHLSLQVPVCDRCFLHPLLVGHALGVYCLGDSFLWVVCLQQLYVP